MALAPAANTSGKLDFKALLSGAKKPKVKKPKLGA